MDLSNNRKFSVSVVIPAYNAGKYIGRAIESVLAQSRAADEIIVVDDGSNDDTAEVVGGYGSKVRLIRQENAGASAARNTGIKAAACEWIAFLDGDDEWLDNNLQLQTELLRRNPNLMWSCGNYIRCLCDEKHRLPDLAPNKCKQLLAGKDYFDSYFAAHAAFAGGCTDTMLIKRDVLIEAGLFSPDQRRFNDMDTWWRIAYRHPEIGFVIQPLAIRHMVIQDSISQKKRPAAVYCDIIAKHLKLADEHNKLDEFKPLATTMLRRWMRSMLFDARANNIRSMMEQFDSLLPGWYKIFMRILTAFPRTTALGCHAISRIVRTLRLRRQLVPRPK